MNYNEKELKLKYGPNYTGVKECPVCKKQTPHIVTKWKRAKSKDSLGARELKQVPAQIECLFCWQKNQGMRVY
ncbi:MAG: hypothetical protein RDV48_17925 [Candidatus Eremiobacteraeota bacterium]|nr:hypothetical protein [Candidatus Eremiobacteraeota bacterium]